MPRLLLVARNPGLAFGLASASDDIIEVRPSLVGRLEVSPGMADVVVIEQERPEEALVTLDMLRAGGLMAPALLVASARPEWAELDPGVRPSVAVLDPPITQDRLEQSVGSTAVLPGADTPAAVADVQVTELEAEPEPQVSEPPDTEPEPGWDEVAAAEDPVPAPSHEPHAPDPVEVVFSDALAHDGIPVVPAVSALEEDLPIAAAAAETQDDDTEPDLPEGPLDLEPTDDPYATATHVEAQPEDAEDADATFQPQPVEAAAEQDAEPAADAERDAEAEPAAEAAVDTEPVVEPDAVDEAEHGTEDTEETGETGETAETTEDAEPLPTSGEWEPDGADRALDPAMLAIPSAAPLRQPESVRIGAAGRDAVPAVVLYDEEDELIVAEGTPSPAAWQPGVTEPVVAWQGAGTARDARVYAEMASLVAASGEALADLPETDDAELAAAGVLVEDMPAIDLRQVFGDPDDLSAWPTESLDQSHGAERGDDLPLGAAFAGDGVVEDDEAMILPVEAETEAALARGVPEQRPHVEIVDLREQLPEDPRSTPSLVRALLARSHEVYGVSEAGGLVVGDALARTGAGAGALLLPDGDIWRVAAGEGLRRLEHRYVLGADSWLVTTIASRHKGIIIDRTDVARRPLAGAPLAAHKHLVAAPVRAVAGILLIARDDDPAFGERDLLSLARLAEASAGILASALDARQLARLLGDIRDQDDKAAADRIDYGF